MKGTPREGIRVAVLLTVVAAGGCGRPGQEEERDVPTLNAELAQQETRLGEGLAALDWDGTAEACRFAASALAGGEETVAGLPVDGVDARVALASALAQFREGAEKVAEAVSKAALDETAAKADAQESLDRLRAVGGVLAEEVEAKLPEWRKTQKEIAGQLATWRQNRLEKMEHEEYATFPAFRDSAARRYDEWTEWTDGVHATIGRVREKLRPEAEAASEQLAERAGAVRLARESVERGISALQAMPISRERAMKARREAVAVFNEKIRSAASAVEAEERELADWSTEVCKRAEKLLERASALESDIEGLSGDVSGQLDPSAVRKATEAAAKAREMHKDMMAAAANHETGRQKLGQDWAPLRSELQAVATAANEVAKMTHFDEQAVVRDAVLIESLRRRIEEADIGGQCERLRAFCRDAESKLVAEETGLTAAGNEFASARAQAARTSARIELERNLADLNQASAPGWTRPEGKAKELRATIEAFLSEMDSMGDAQFLERQGRVREETRNAKEYIAAHTVWTPGAPHPDYPNIHAADRVGAWTPDPGYDFAVPSNGSGDLRARWKPGVRVAGHPHVTAGHEEGSWRPDPGYKARWEGDLEPRWTEGERHPSHPHIHASDTESRWTPDAGYEFAGRSDGTTELSVRWKAGERDAAHPHVSAGQVEGTWVPEAGYRARWNGDRDPVWTPGTRHPDYPHVSASNTAGKWEPDPGYAFSYSNGYGDLTVHWNPGANHPHYKGIQAGNREGAWEAKPGWVRNSSRSSDLSARWVPGRRWTGHPHIQTGDQEDNWVADDGYRFRSLADDGDFSVVWTPGWLSPDGKRRAKEREGQWETKRKCTACRDGYKETSEKCGTCGGTGKLPILSLPCPECLGQKRIKVRRVCDRCNGQVWYWP